MIARSLRTPLLALFLAGCATPPAAETSAQPAAASAFTVVYLVRHAERADAPAGDPGLSAAGAARALALRDSLRGAGITSIVTSDRRRTQETARPLAEALGVTPAIVAVGSSTPDHVAAVAREVRARAAASPGAILVVGHSNTIPAIVHALGGPELPDLCDTQFAVLFTLRLPDPGHAPARVERRVVGTPDAPVGDECAAMSPR